MTEKEEKTIQGIKEFNELNKALKSFDKTFKIILPILFLLTIIGNSIYQKNFQINSLHIIIITAIYALYYHLRGLTSVVGQLILKIGENDQI